VEPMILSLNHPQGPGFFDLSAVEVEEDCPIKGVVSCVGGDEGASDSMSSSCVTRS